MNMKLSNREWVVLGLGLAVSPIAAAVLTPSVDVISMVIVWFGLVLVFLIGFFVVHFLTR